MEEKKVPKLRFKGFVQEWEQRKLEELGNLNRGKSKHRPRNDSRLFGGEYPFIQTGDVAKAPLFLTEYSQAYSEFGIQQSKLWDIGTLLITIAANVADTTILGIKAAFPDSVIGFESTSCDVVFIKNYIDLQSDLLKRKAETSSQANLNLAKLKEMNLNIPKLKEQQKIGTFFKQLDDTIALHQRKIEQLKLLKQAFLQKMLANQENVPELRFADFDEVWVQRKVSDLSDDTYGGGTPSTNNSVFWKGEIPWIQSSDISMNTLFKTRPKRFITEEAIEKSAAKIIPANSITIVTRVGVGKIALISHEFSTSQDFLSLANLKVDPLFGLYSLYKMLQSELNKTQGTSIKGITKTDLLDKQLIIPTILIEQEKIGILFKQFNDTIELHQKKWFSLKKLKTAFLQSMFISK